MVNVLLSDEGRARVLSTIDWVTRFYQRSIHEDSTPITAVCTQSGNWKRTVMPLGFAASPGWFQSIILHVCEGLERVRPFIDDIACFLIGGADTRPRPGEVPGPAYQV